MTHGRYLRYIVFVRKVLITGAVVVEANPPDAWRYRVSAVTGWPGVRLPKLREIASLICSFYLSVAVLVSQCVPVVHFARCWDSSSQETRETVH